MENKILPPPGKSSINSAIIVAAFATAFLFAGNVKGQDEGNDPGPVDFQPNSWIQANQVVPPSPQAAALGRFGNVPVNYHSGSPAIEIPLHTISGKYLSMPVVLSYDANAVTVGSLPSWTGLGWTLQAGGVITRSVQGNPDMDWNFFAWENNYTSQFDPNMNFAGLNLPENPQIDNDIMENNFYYEVIRGEIETQPDVYYFNLPGFSGSFVITRHKQIILRDYTDWKIEANWGWVSFPANPLLGTPAAANTEITGFTLTDPEGNRYIFQDAEYTEFMNDMAMTEPLPSQNPRWFRFNSSWYLTMIISCDGSERIDLANHKISQDVAGNQEPYIAPVNIDADNSITYSLQNQDVCCGGTEGYLSGGNSGDGLGLGGARQIFNRRYLQSATFSIGAEGVEKLVFGVSHPGGDTPSGPRSSGIQLDSITIQRRWQGVWEDATGFFMNYDFSTGRLTLKSVQERSKTGAENKPPFRLDYDGWALPSVWDNSIDFWGYFNGAGNTNGLVPSVNLSGVWYQGHGADRKAGDHLNGVLNRMEYPLGGATEFEFESHEIPELPHIGTKVGGFRIARITDYTESGAVGSKRTFRYVDPGGASSGRLLQSLVIFDLPALKHWPTDGVGCEYPVECPCNEYPCNSITIYAAGNGEMGHVQGSHIGYGRVEEIIGDQSGNIGKNIYYFENNPPGDNIWDTGNGTLKRLEVWEGGGTPHLVKEIDYVYTFNAPCPGQGGCTETVANKIVSKKLQDNKIRLCKRASDGVYEWTPINGTTSYYPTCSEVKVFKTKFEGKPYLIRTSWRRLDEVKTTEHFYEPGTPGTVAKTMAYDYSDAGLGMPTDIYFNNSHGEEFRTQIEYFSSALVKAVPKKVKKTVDGQIAAGTNQQLDGYGRPMAIYEILRDQSELLRITIPGYISGRPSGATFMGELPETYTWTNGLLKKRVKGVWEWTYDYNNLRLPVSFTDIDGQATLYEYDGLMRLSKIRARNDNIQTSFSYIYGGPSKVVTTTSYTDAPTQTISEEFDGLGRPIRTVHNGVVKKELFYDPFGRLWKETYLPGNFTTYEFDDTPLARVVEQIFPDGSSVRTHYGAQDNCYKTTTIDEKGNPSSALTEIAGRTYKTIDALGGQTTFTYFAGGSPETVTPPSGGQYKYDYDNRWRLIEKEVPGAAPLILRYYDENNLLRYSIDGNGNRLDHGYDEYNREIWTKLREGVNIGGGDHGSPGDVIRTFEYGETLGGINVGRLKITTGAVFGGPGPAQTIYDYDPYGRVSEQREKYPISSFIAEDVFNYSYNHADWLLNEARQHSGYVSRQTATTQVYDNFGRVITRIFGTDLPGGMAVAMTYNDRDEMTSKKFGSLGGNQFLEKAVYKYTERGWLRSINDIIPRVSDLRTCEPPPVKDDKPVQTEETAGLEELLEYICNGEVVNIDGLDPCANGDCYEEVASYVASFRFRAPSSDGKIMKIVAAGDSILLPNFPYEQIPQEQAQFVTDLSAWMNGNGYFFENIECYHTLDGFGIPIAWVRIEKTNLRFDYLKAFIAKGPANIPFIEYDRSLLPCENLPEHPIGLDSQQPASVAALDQVIAGQDSTSFTYPTVLYKVVLLDGSFRWVFREELPILRGRYSRRDRIHIGSDQQSLTIERTDKTIADMSLARFLADRPSGDILKVDTKTEDENSPECNPTPPQCTPAEQEQQEESLGSIMNKMCNIDPAQLSFPVTLYLVQLCDGSLVYILGADLLNDLEGNYEVLDELVITGPDQVFDVVVEKREPLFAMDFHHEANGNISRARWKVTNHNPKFYLYGYDPLNRITEARYGEEILQETPSGQIQGVSLLNDIYRAFGFEYDPVGNLLAVKRNGMIPDGNCYIIGLIDDLKITPDPNTHHLKTIEDTAPTPFREYGFKPGPGGLYEYDQNGNLTYDPHKELKIVYNFLNLPQQITKIGGGGSLLFAYDAWGRKWTKEGAGGKREYVLGIEYHDGKQEAIFGPDGRIVAVYDENGVNITGFRPEYWHTDHLGNVRLAFSDVNNNGRIEIEDDPGTLEDDTEIMQENHYYPFGMNQLGPWYETVAPKNQYQYNGKELNEELGLDWYDYGARWYDVAVGRFTGVDPLAEDYYKWNSFNYVLNSPTNAIDPNGGWVYFTNRRGAKRVADDWNIIYRAKYGVEDDAFGVAQKMQFTATVDEIGNLNLELRETNEFRIVTNDVNFDFNTDVYTAALYDLLNTADYNIKGSFQNTRALQEGYGFTKSSTEFMLYSGLPASTAGENTVESIAAGKRNVMVHPFFTGGSDPIVPHTAGGIAMHELLYHISPQGIKDGRREVALEHGPASGPDIMRRWYGLRETNPATLRLHGPGDKNIRFSSREQYRLNVQRARTGNKNK
jgi:RHS repeat-associated protein